MRFYIQDLGKETLVTEMFTYGSYKYGYIIDANTRYLVRYDYGTFCWCIACKAS